MNGDEEGIDCGGSKCRPCRTCTSRELKELPLGTYSMPDDGSESFSSGSTRSVLCSDGYHLPSPDSPEKITCRDGVWSKVKNPCLEDTIEVWKGTFAITHGEDFDFTIVPAITSAFNTLLTLIYPEFTDHSIVRIATAGSCSAMDQPAGGDGDDCEDNPLVASTGFGCEMLAGVSLQDYSGYNSLLLFIVVSLGAICH